MAKAVLVMDMPECCADCPCSFFERDNPILNLICGAAQEDAYNVGKPDWCPLRELPEKRDTNHNKNHYITNHNKNHYISNIWADAKSVGWNACLNKILEGCDKK